MNTAELIKLESWLATNVMGWRNEPTAMELDRQGFHPATDPASGLSVLEKCAGWLMPRNDALSVCQKLSGAWRVTNVNTGRAKDSAEAPTLPLAIALFAKRIYDNIEARRPPDFVDDGRIRPQRD